MDHVNIVTLGLLLFVACVVAILSRRVGLPYTIGLVIAGIGLSVVGYRSQIVLTPELIFTVLLPPLIFEAALHLDWRQSRREAPLVLSLAFVGTLLSAGVVAVGMHFVVGWSWLAALIFGSLIAATDPVSVIAMMKEEGAEPRLRFLMESESIVNDGAAAVLFALCVAAIGGGPTDPLTISLTVVTTVVGGVVCGLAVAGGLLLLAGRAEDHLVELTLSVLAAYGSFLIAEEVHVSPVLATLAAGMLIGNLRKRDTLSERGGEAIVRFWDFAAFLANSIVFLLIGSREAEQPLLAIVWPAAVGTVLVIVGRAAAIFPITTLFARSKLAVDAPTRTILFWGGLRGALALALALAVPTTLPERDVLIAVAFAVVAFSIFVQGLTVPRLLRRGRAEPPA